MICMFVHHQKAAVLVVLKYFSPENIRDWVFIAEIITAILALVFYKKYKSTFLRYFLFVIWYSIANEVFAMYYVKHINENNLVLFNVNKVLVFIPPPVDPGDAPINIKIINTNNPAFVKLLNG